MKIGLVTGEFPPMQGGVGDYTRELALALAALGVEVHVITRRTSAGFQSSAFAVHPVVGSWSFRALFQIRALATALGLDLLNLQYQAAAYDLSAPIHFLPRLVGLSRLKSVVTFHDLRIPYLFPKAGALRPAAVTYLARTASGAIVTDPAEWAELRQRGVAKVAQIPIGSNIAPTPPAGYDRATWRGRLGVGAHEFLLGYFGFLNESKGGDLLVEVLARLAEGGAPVKLVLIGGRTGASDATNAAFGDKLDARIVEQHLTDRILRTGFVAPAEVSAHLLACDAVILPYRDGVSFRRGSLMAALAHGCPIISTPPALPLAELREGENICLVPPEAGALTQAVLALASEPERRARLGEGARALSALFAWDQIATRTVAFYQSLGVTRGNAGGVRAG
jgi:glycosyltransferase involved in cell wall biosynthesis